VKRGIADNLVEVRREGGDLVFLVNDVVVKTLPWETCSGGAVGFACLGKTSVVVESLSIWGADSRTP
ncbi:MAG: hypothetical protein HGA84_00300, partial [Syntrophobacteraceae bacterium]|nr:hypothetical protein [Syntrophobacteraceae bacterium]